ncbi:dTDP-4-dehydrorhamnose reductase [hydrothermal vent metagenome]|uniref:dTDP-4-dehydrorhamnose reductase n=1 Tax=hydrothermal vent metagenome TaxID=652676 RepID=A0A3B1C2J6_9ZZZZ
MRLGITGAKGLLGRAIVRRINEALPTVSLIAFTRNDFDITDKDAVYRAVSGSDLDVVINCAAYSAVDKAEQEEDLAYAVNATAVGYIAQACASTGAKLVHISSDYVFDGSKKEPYKEDDPPCPIGAYARSKADGEKEALSRCPGALIIRSAWLYGHDGPNFVSTILEKGKSAGKLNVVNDQIGSPTYADDLALAIGRLIEKEATGIVNAVNSGYCSWYDLAVEALTLAGLDDVEVSPVSSDEYKTLATRPKNSQLDTSLFERITDAPMRHWRDALKEYIK